MRAFLFVLRLLLGALFVLASVDKVAHPEAFVVSVDKYQLLPTPVVPLVAVTLPWIELLAGIALIAGIGVEGAALVTTVLLVVFLSGMGINLARGRELDCGCFGFLLPNEQVGPISLARDGVVLVVSVVVALWGRRSWGAGGPGRWREGRSRGVVE